MNTFLAVLRRDLRLALRRSGDLATVVLFFILTASLFPFGVGPDPNLLARMAPGIVWVTALLAVLLSLERIFLADYEDGSLELLRISPVSLELVVLAKITAHWLTTGLPLTAAAPILAILFNLPSEALPTLLLTLLIGTPTLSLVGAVGAALTLGARRGGVLIPLLVLPLNVPVLIFGTGAVDAAIGGFSAQANLALLGAIGALMLFVGPVAAAAAVRQAVE